MEKKTVVVTIRFPAVIDRKIDAYARRHRLTRSEVVRSAVDRMLAEEDSAQGKTLLEQLAPWVGVVHGGGKYPAHDSKRLYAEYIEEKHARRSR